MTPVLSSQLLSMSLDLSGSTNDFDFVKGDSWMFTCLQEPQSVLVVWNKCLDALYVDFIILTLCLID